MNTSKATAKINGGIRATSELPAGARYKVAVADVLSHPDCSVSDVFHAAVKFHVDPGKLLTRTLEALPA
ncbi:hypothetical protein [Leifsonia sp. 22587]|uniref:hypothetical protein n=1 Tax=Leifsonia sp. 22587 TaxID=3453946 RepID=UPI003F878C7A